MRVCARARAASVRNAHLIDVPLHLRTCMASATLRAHRSLVCAAVLLVFVLQIPPLLSSCSAHTIVVHSAATARPMARRRLLLVSPVRAAQSLELEKEETAPAPYPRSTQRRPRSSSSSRSAFMNAVSKHQVPSGANPDSN